MTDTSPGAPAPTVRDVRYQAAVVRDGSVLLLRYRLHGTREFWVLPGGGRLPGEEEAACVAREVAEETGLEVAVGELLLDVPAEPPDGFYQRWRTYRCTVVRGEPQPGCEPEPDSVGEILGVRWLDLRDPDAWDAEVRGNRRLAPQLLLVRRALGHADVRADVRADASAGLAEP